MPITGKLMPWDKTSIDLLTEPIGAVYALFDKSEECIYIGETSDLKARFIEYWSTYFAEDPCKRDTVAFKVEYTKNHKEREMFFLTEYALEHDGKLPRCNRKMP